MKPSMLTHTRHYSEYDLTHLTGKATAGVISITEPGRVVPLDEDLWACVLRLYFHDIVPQQATRQHTLFSAAQADQIISWLTEHEDELSGVYVHCAAGISRSAAVAKFIADVYGLFFDYKRGKDYNGHVYDTLMARYKERSKRQRP